MGDVMVAMRDGVRLATDIYLPARDGIISADHLPTILERMDVRRKEQDRSTTHGHLFERDVGEALGRLAGPAGDALEHHGNKTGTIAYCKVGDYTVTLSDDSAAPGAVIVIEAKEDASYALADMLAEARQACANRGASICLFVVSKKTAPAGLPPFSRHLR